MGSGRGGRVAGRRNPRQLSFAIDQFIVRNPSYFFGASPEHALINPDNLRSCTWIT